jgi:phosphoglucomutase
LAATGDTTTGKVIQTAMQMSAANGFGRVLVGQGGILSTPAASHLIRKYGAFGGLILSASHNPGGPNRRLRAEIQCRQWRPCDGKHLTDAIYARSQVIDRYLITDFDDVDLDQIGTFEAGGMVIEVIDPVTDYAELMETLFDFDAIRAMIAGGFKVMFDAMHAVTGPYAKEIFVRRLGADPTLVLNATPLEDFGGHHPDPNLVHAKALHDTMMSARCAGFRCSLRWRWRP